MLTRYPEPLVARVTGIAKSTLVTLRRAQLSKPADWDVERNVVCYTPAGLEKLVGALGLNAAALAWPADGGEGEEGGSEVAPALEAPAAAREASQPPAKPEKNGARETWPWPFSVAPLPATLVAALVDEIQKREPVELTVKRLSFNPTLLHGVDAENKPVTVRVASNVNFMAGMKLKALPPLKDGAQVFTMIGRCPRWRGRF